MQSIERKQQVACSSPIVLSIVMPNFNHAAYLSEALTAIFAQSRAPDEVIIIDDGSTDNSRNLIAEWASRQASIRPVVNATNVGAIACINKGLRLARGDFVCLMAADDVCRPGFFSAGVAALTAHPTIALFCAEISIYKVGQADRSNEIRPVVPPSHRPRVFTAAETRDLHIRNDNFVIPLATMYRRAFLLAEGGFDPDLGSMADGFLTKKLALKHGFFFAPQVVATWQVRDVGLSRSTARSSLAVLDLIAKGRSCIDKDDVFPPGYANMFDRRFRFAACRLAITEGKTDWGFLETVGARNAADRLLISFASNLPFGIGNLLALSWLALRLRPYSFFAIAITAIRRKWFEALHRSI